MNKKLLLTSLAAFGVINAGSFAFNPTSLYNTMGRDKTDTTVNLIQNKTDTAIYEVPQKDQNKVTDIINSAVLSTRKVDLSSNATDNVVSKTVNKFNINDRENITKVVNVNLVKTTEQNITLNGLSAKDYYIALYYKAIIPTTISSIKLNTSKGIITITPNVTAAPGQKITISLLPGKLLVIVDGKIAYNKDLSNTDEGNYNSIVIKTSAKLVFDKIKTEYIGADLVEQKNKAIITSTSAEDNISRTETEIVPSQFQSIQQAVNKKIIWNKDKGQFDIDTNTTSVDKVTLHLDPSLTDRISQNKTIYDIISNFNTTFDGLTFVTNAIDFDGNPNTTEVVFKDTSGNYYIYQIQINKTVDGTTTTYSINVPLLYKGTEDVTKVVSTELDGDTTTKEWYIQTPQYVSVLQYAKGKIRNILFAPNEKIYFGKLLTKNGVQWKVLIGLSVDTTARNGKYYVLPVMKLYWYDKNKGKYFPKQITDWSDYDTLKLKIGGNYVYYKDNGTVDYSKTDYIQ